jgi:hypothetical protein
VHAHTLLGLSWRTLINTACPLWPPGLPHPTPVEHCAQQSLLVHPNPQTPLGTACGQPVPSGRLGPGFGDISFCHPST